MTRATATRARLITADELQAMGDIGRCELIRGQLNMMSPAGYRHGNVAGNIHALLWNYVKKHKLGNVLAAESGFVLESDPDTVRAPDVAFIRKDRLPGADHVKFFKGAPDLAVEVLSPEDRLAQIVRKVGDWLSAGAQTVWVVNPKTNTITVYRDDQTIAIFQDDDTIKNDPAVPGFKMKVEQAFE